MSSDNVAAEQLGLFIERIERREEEKKGIAEDVKDVYDEAKSNGYDTKTMRALVRLRRLEKHARQEAEALLEPHQAEQALAYSGTRMRRHSPPRQLPAKAPRSPPPREW